MSKKQFLFFGMCILMVSCLICNTWATASILSEPPSRWFIPAFVLTVIMAVGVGILGRFIFGFLSSDDDILDESVSPSGQDEIDATVVFPNGRSKRAKSVEGGFFVPTQDGTGTMVTFVIEGLRSMEMVNIRKLIVDFDEDASYDDPASPRARSLNEDFFVQYAGNCSVCGTENPSVVFTDDGPICSECEASICCT